MDFLDIPGLNIAQKSGGKGWNPANGVPFCARAYICRPRPLGPAGHSHSPFFLRPAAHGTCMPVDPHRNSHVWGGLETQVAGDELAI